MLKSKANEDIAELVKCGAYQGLSIGYITRKSYRNKQGKRVITELDWYEVSLVTIPVNPESKILEIKAMGASKDLPLAERDYAWDNTKAVQRIREFTKSKDKPSVSYKKAFMYYDAENADNFGAYKLPFADIVDGKIMAIPRAIFAISGVLRGARGGVDIPEEDKAKVKALVEKYYKKMADKFDDEKLKSPFEKKSFESIRDTEQYLMDSGLSKKESCKFISIIKGNERDAIVEDLGEPVNTSMQEINELKELFKKIKEY